MTRKADGFVSDMLMVASRLADLLAEENKALARHRPDEAKALQDRKSALARAYGQHVAALADAPALLDEAPSDSVERLRAVCARLESGARENSQLLRASMEANERLLKTVIAAIKEQHAEGAARYGSNGALRPEFGPSGAMAVSLNQTL